MKFFGKATTGEKRSANAHHATDVSERPSAAVVVQQLDKIFVVEPSATLTARPVDIPGDDWAGSMLEAPSGVSDDRSETIDAPDTSSACQDGALEELARIKQLSPSYRQNMVPITTSESLPPKKAPKRVCTPHHISKRDFSSYFSMEDETDEPDWANKHSWLASLPRWLGSSGHRKTMEDTSIDGIHRKEHATSKKMAETDHANVSCLTRMGLFLCSSAALYTLVFIGMAAGLTYGTMNQVFSNIDWGEQITVAFVGTSYLFVNDVPRLMEAVSGGQIIQDSCLRSGGSLANVVLSGNGMYYRWQTNEALIDSGEKDTTEDDGTKDDDSSATKLYDYGACSVHQLLTGYDNYLEYGNKNRAYSDDGNNPCLVDETYFEYITSRYASQTAPSWDYVVLADQSKRMAASENSRYDTIDALVNVYAPLLQQSGSIPVIVDTHAFWSAETNMTGLVDVPTFTQMIYQGVEEYADALASELPSDQAPIVVPIGLAYLMIWEENYEYWESLFLSDNMHSSLSGSYLFACVLYTKLFGHLPKRAVSIPRHMEYLFAFSRRTIGQNAVYPSQGEAEYLRAVANRIVLKGEVPKSFTGSYSQTRDNGGYR